MFQVESFRSEEFRFWMLMALFAVIFCFGGGARDDIQSLVLLRPISFLFIAYALTTISREQFFRLRWPLAGLATLAVMMIVQLIPLPPALGAKLPGHALNVAVLREAQVADVWRPISLSPSRTLNSLFSLGVPLAVLLLAGGQGRQRWPAVVLGLLIIGSCSALLGLAQVAGPSDGPLYLYQVTNPGRAVGLFSNANHHGFFLACVIMLAAWYYGLAISEKRGLAQRAMPIAVMLLAFVVSLMTGTRSGFLLTLLATGGGFYAIRAMGPSPLDRQRGRSQALRRSVMVVAVLAAITTSLFLYSRIPALNRLLEKSPVSDIRVDLLPIIVRIGRNYFPEGIGFGAFEHVFKVFEPDSMLDPTYLNQAHNDVLQFLVEGGLPAFALMIGLVIGYIVQVIAVVKRVMRRRSPDDWLALCALAVMAILLIASLSDYPLRSPALMAIFAVCQVVALLPSNDAEAVQRPKNALSPGGLSSSPSQR